MTEIEILYKGNLATEALHKESGAKLLTDAPKDNQGKGENFSPTDLVGVALGSCVLTLMGIVAKRLGVDLAGSKVLLTKEMASLPLRRIAKLTLFISCPRSFDENIRVQLEKAGKLCPVHQSLHPDIVQEFHFTWGRT